MSIGLVTLARALQIAFVVIALSSLFPLQIFNVLWQQRLITNLINNIPLLLTAAGFLLLDLKLRPVSAHPEPDAESDPDLTMPLSPSALRAQRLQWRCRLTSFLCLLLMVFQLFVSMGLIRQADSGLSQRYRQLVDQTEGLNTILQDADQPQTLNRLSAALLPNDQRSRFSSLPPTKQREQLADRIAQINRSMNQELGRARGRSVAGIVVDGLRNLALAAVFGLVFFRLSPVQASQ